jgi:N,N-dimethylformamidase beta subunit-like protein
VEVSYDRPYDTVTGAGGFFARDAPMVRFLERYRYPVSYTTSESVDEDPWQLLGHRWVWTGGFHRSTAAIRL